MRMLQNVCRSMETIPTNRNEVHDEKNSGNAYHYSVPEVHNLFSTMSEISINKTILPLLPMVVKSGFLL
jgi:hypothetical protein